MAASRSFAALVDQDSIVILEYAQERAGFRLIATESRSQRFASPEAAADAIAEMLAGMKAKRASVSIVLQHFGSFFHTLVIPPASDEHLRPIIVNEVRRSFNIAEPAIAFTTGASVERREPARAGGQVPRHVFVAGAPKSVVDSLQARFAKARIRVDGLTVIPEVFRQLYDALDGSTETTAVLVCLHNGPHVAFFVNGQMELAIEPPLSLDGEAPLDTSVIIDQLERGAIFLRQQARGAVATRLLLAAPATDYESLASTIEARTGMRVAPLGEGIGSPESVVAMGAVIAARTENRLDFYPRPPAFDEQLKAAMSGPGLLTSTLMTAAVLTAFWAAMQVLAVHREGKELGRVQSQVERALPTITNAQQSAIGRERIAAIRSALREANLERMTVTDLMSHLAAAPQSGTQLDSIRLERTADGLDAKVFGRSVAPTGPMAMSAATSFYRHFGAVPGLMDLGFESAYTQSGNTNPSPTPSTGEELRFTISFVAPVATVGGSR
jgi:hypothetical protein